MDKILAKKLSGENGVDLRKKITQLASEYLQVGRSSVDYYAADFDVAHDLFQCYSQLTRTDLENLEHGSPRRFILPMTSTQITTMATFIAQSLFGTATPHKVEGRGPEDEVSSMVVNQLLRWNDEQQPTYAVGYMWVLDALLYNRGIMFECFEGIYKNEVTAVEVDDPDHTPKEGEEQKKYTSWKKTKKKVGAYNKVYLVSPYDFICDPDLPLYRLNDMRFAGHRAKVPWIALKNRSMLPVGDANYVFPDAVERLRTKKKGLNESTYGPTTSGTAAATLSSRTSFDRVRSPAPFGNEIANKEDGGFVEVYELRVKIIPKEYDLSDSEEVETWRLEIGNGDELLSASFDISAHNEFPYSIGEGRPSPHYQYTPSWCLELKPIQDYVDFLKNRRQEAISNTIGNIFIVRPDKVDMTDFDDMTKEKKFIPIRAEAADTDIKNIIQQVPIQDLTQTFTADLGRFMGFAELTSGANSTMQGVAGDESATAEAGAQQMAIGRMSSVGRLLSVQGLVPQTRRFVSNFQQFLDSEFVIRIKGDLFDLPQEFVDKKLVTVNRDSIQGTFDYIPSDGALPGTDAKKAAALIRMIEASATMPFLFNPTQAGSIDIKKLFAAAVKASGVNMENFIVKNPQPAPGMPGVPPVGAPPAPVEAPAPGVPSSEPRAQDLGGGLKAPNLSVAPLVPQIRPSNV